MSVIKNMRNLSSMEFYKKAIDLRKEITIWLLKDFGYKRNARSVKRVIKDISEEDKKTIDDIFIKYGKNVNKEYESVYPEWFVEDERKIIMEEELRMKNAKVLSQKEVKDILAEHFGVKPEDVISTKYSYIITESEDSKDGRENIHD